MERAQQRLTYVIPLTLLVIFVLLYLNTRSLAKVLIVLLAVPFSLVGAFLLLYLLGYNLSVAVWVGIIALAGVDAETGVVMLLYLDHAYERERRAGHMNSLADLEKAVHGRRRAARAAEDDDGHGHPHGPAADHVVHGDRVRRDEAHRRPDGRWGRHFVPPGTADLPGDLHHLEVVGRGAARRGHRGFGIGLTTGRQRPGAAGAGTPSDPPAARSSAARRRK